MTLSEDGWLSAEEYSRAKDLSLRQVYRRLKSRKLAGAIKDPQGRWRIPKEGAVSLMAPPLTREAWELCSRGDHSFLGEDQYEGWAYTVATETTHPGGGVALLWDVRTCGRCGHRETY